MSEGSTKGPTLADLMEALVEMRKTLLQQGQDFQQEMQGIRDVQDQQGQALQRLQASGRDEAALPDSGNLGNPLQGVQHGVPQQQPNPQPVKCQQCMNINHDFLRIAGASRGGFSANVCNVGRGGGHR